jgi:hypothetical protein
MVISTCGDFKQTLGQRLDHHIAKADFAPQVVRLKSEIALRQHSRAGHPVGFAEFEDCLVVDLDGDLFVLDAWGWCAPQAQPVLQCDKRPTACKPKSGAEGRF